MNHQPSRTAENKDKVSKQKGRDSSPPVLVIDDSDISLDAMTEILQKEGLEVITLRSAFGATKTVLRNRIEVVVTDVNMPALRGNNLIAFFKKNPKLHHIRVVLVSSLPLEELNELAEKSGADGVVSKNNLETDLIPVVKQQLYKRKKST